MQKRVTLRRVLQSIAERVKAIAEKLTGAESRILLKDADNLLTLAKEMNKALKDAGENVGTQKNTADSGVRYKLNENARTELHKALYDKNYKGELLLRDNTPAIMLSQKGVRDLPMTMKVSHVRENVFTEAEAAKQGLPVTDYINYHGIGEELFLKVLDGLDNVTDAYRGTRYADNPSRRENYFLLISAFTDDNGDTINVPVYIEETALSNKVYFDVNKIATVFGKENLRAYLKKEIKNKNLVKIKNRSNSSSESNAPIARDYRSIASTDSISNSDDNVKKKSYSYGDEEVDLYGLLDSEESGDTKASKRLQSFIDIAGQMINDTRHIELKNGKVRRIVYNTLKKYTGEINKEYSERIELILDTAMNSNKYSAEDIVGEIAAVIKDAMVNSKFSLDVYAEDRIEILDTIKGFSKVYLTQGQLNALSNNGRSLEWFRRKMLGVINVVPDGRGRLTTQMPSFEDLYNQLTKVYPGWFKKVSSDKMPLELIWTLDSMKPQYIGIDNYFHQDEDITSVSVSIELIALISEEKYKSAGKTVQRKSKNPIDLANDSMLSKLVADKHGSQRYKIISDYILKQLGGRMVVLSDGKNAVVDNSDAKHIASNAGAKKTAQISQIKEIVNRAKLVAEEESTKDNKFTDFYYYEAFVKFGKESFPVYLNVGRAKNDGTYHIYDITQKLRDTAHRVNDVGRPVGNALKNGISDISIYDSEQNVNQSYLSDIKEVVKTLLPNSEFSRHRMGVERGVHSMLTWIGKPTKTRHVPDTIKQPLEDMLVALHSNNEFSESMRDLAKVLKDKAYEIAESYASGTFEFNAEFINVNTKFVSELENFAKKHKDDTFQTLNGRAMSKLNGLIVALRHTLVEVNTMHQNLQNVRASELGKASIEDFAKKKSNRYRDTGNVLTKLETAVSIADELLLFETADAFTFMKMLGSAGESVMQELWEGYKKFIENVDDIKRWTEENIDQKDVKKWRKETHTAVLEKGGRVTLTTPQLMELYVLAKRKQAQGHIFEDGIVIERNLISEKEERKKGNKKVYVPKPYSLTLQDVTQLTSMLSRDQIRVADAMQEYLTEIVGALGNEVTMKLYAYKHFVSLNYWPIHTFSDKYKVTGGILNLHAVANPKSTKHTQKRANNAIVVHDIFTSFSKHCGQMAMYNGMAIPLTDAIKWYNYTDENGDSVNASMKNALSVHANDWFLKFISDLNNQSKGMDKGFKLLEFLIRNEKAAAIWMNLKVAIQQPSAFIRASMLIDPKYLADPRNITDKHGIEEMLEYCPIAKWKSYGFYTTDIGNSLENIILPVSGISDMAKDVGFALPGFMDKATWGVLWNACKRQVLAQNKAIKKNSEEHMRLTADLLDKVVNETQVVDTPFHRAQIRRIDKFYEKIISSFMDEPIKDFNVLRNALKTGGIKKLGKAGLVLALTSTANAILKAVIDTFVRGAADDDEEDDEGKIFGLLDLYEPEDGLGLKYLDTVLENTLENLNLLTKHPYANALYSSISDAFSGNFSSQSLGESGISNMAKSIYHWVKRIKGESSRPFYADLYESAKAFSQLSGLGIHTVIRDGVGIVNNFLPDGFKITTQGYTKTSLAEYAVDALLRGDKELYDDLYDKLYDKCGGARYKDDVEKVLYGALSKTPDARVAITAMENGDKKLYDKTVNELLDKGFSLNVVIKGTNSLRSSYNNKVVGIYEAREKGDNKKVEEYYQALEKIGFTREEIDEDVKAYEEGREAWKFDKISDASMLYNYSFLLTMLDSNQMKEYEEIYDYLIDHGKSDSDIKSAVTRNYKGEYFDAWLNSDTKELRRIEGKLEDTGFYEDIEKDTQEWLVSELKKMYLSTDDPKEREEVRTLLWKTGKWDSLYDLDKRLEAWREADGE